MTSLQSRPKSQSQSAAALTNRGFGTRVVYKNAKEEYNVNDTRSLYQVSFDQSKKAAKPQTPQKPQSRNPAVEQLTLADIVSMKRTSSVKSPTVQKPVGVEIAKGDFPNRKSQSNAGLANTATTAKTASTARENKEREVSPSLSKYNFFGINAKPGDSQIIKDTITKDYSGSAYVKVDEEAEYYEIVKRLDVCGKCWSAQQKYYTNPFKINHKGPGKSLYQKDYVKHPLDSQGPVLKNDFYSTWQNNTPVDYGTTMSADFKDWKAPPPKRETMNWRPATSDMPFAGSSNYRTDYANWGANPIAALKAPQNKTIIPELPFMSATTYGANFSKPDATTQLKPVDRDLWKKNKSPFASAIPFLGESTNAATYKPFKVTPAPNFEVDNDYQPTEALPEHLKSLYKKDFPGEDPWKCPAKIFMENNVHPKYKHLSA